MGKKRRSCEVVDVDPCGVSLKPILVEFEHGLLKKEEVRQLKCDIMVNAENSKDYMLVVNSKEEEYKYRGRKISDESQLCQRFFVIRNKRTNKIRLASVDQIAVSRYIDKLDVEDDLDVVSQKVSLTEFTAEFGTKYAHKKAKSYADKIKTTEDFKSRLEETIIGTEIDSKDLLFNQSKDDNFLPPTNPDATCVRDIFKLDQLFGSAEILNGISEVAQSTLEHCPSQADKEYSAFFVSALKRLKTENGNIDSVKCLLFADALYRFLQLEARKLNIKAVAFSICPTSKHIRNLVLDNFTVKVRNMRTRPLKMKDKGIGYLLVLLMIAFNYRLEYNFMTTHCTKLCSLRKFSTIANAIGFTSNNKLKFWSLEFPLTVKRSLNVSNSFGKKKNKR